MNSGADRDEDSVAHSATNRQYHVEGREQRVSQAAEVALNESQHKLWCEAIVKLKSEEN